MLIERYMALFCISTIVTLHNFRPFMRVPTTKTADRETIVQQSTAAMSFTLYIQISKKPEN